MVFEALADEHIDVDMIVQSVQRSNDDLTDIILLLPILIWRMRGVFLANCSRKRN